MSFKFYALGGKFILILILRVLTGLSETHPQRHHTKFPFLQKTHGKRFSLCRLKIIFLTSYGTVSLIDIFGEQMNDSSVNGKQTKSANAKSAISLSVRYIIENQFHYIIKNIFLHK